MSELESKPCPQCGAPVSDIDGPVHAYVPSSPGCWEAFGLLQADEMMRFGYPPAHRLVVDAYMAQHPGDGTDRRDRQSVFVHLIGLCAVLELGVPAQRATPLLGRALRGHAEFPALTRDGGPGELTLLSLHGAQDLADYERRAMAWARSVWDSWGPHQGLISKTLRPLLAG